MPPNRREVEEQITERLHRRPRPSGRRRPQGASWHCVGWAAGRCRLTRFRRWFSSSSYYSLRAHSLALGRRPDGERALTSYSRTLVHSYYHCCPGVPTPCRKGPPTRSSATDESCRYATYLLLTFPAALFLPHSRVVGLTVSSAGSAPPGARHESWPLLAAHISIKSARCEIRPLLR